MSFTPKGWQNFSNKTTPINSTALKALEQRAVSYATSEALSPGAYGFNDFRVVQRGAGANMSVDVGVAATEMSAWLRDAAGGIYRYQYNGALLNVAISPADPSNPRIDRVVLTAPSSVDSIVPQVVVLAGTPTASADTNNLSGAQAVPVGYELLADIIVGAGVINIQTGNIRDRRRVGGQLGDSSVLPLGGALSGNSLRDELAIMPSPMIPLLSQTLTPTTHDNFQGAYLGYLSRRIVNATRIRWKFAQGATPATSNYNIALLDVSGRLLVAAGATAFGGAANQAVAVSNTIAATTLESGPIIVWMGVAALTAASAVSFFGVQGQETITAPGPGIINLRWSNAAGGTTFPSTNVISAYTDLGQLVGAAAQTAMPMPLFSVSVG